MAANITTNTIAANKLTITPLESGQAAADVNNNAPKLTEARYQPTQLQQIK